MSLRRPRASLALTFRSPSAAVAVAFLLRFFFLWLSHHREDTVHNHFVSWGLAAWATASSKRQTYSTASFTACFSQADSDQ